MNNYRLRIEMPPHQDARVRVEEVIERFDGRIVAEELPERDGARSVDEVVVALPDILDPAALRHQLADHAATELLSSGTDPGIESATLALHWAELILGAEPAHRHRTVRAAIEAACPAANVSIDSDLPEIGTEALQPSLGRVDGGPGVDRQRARASWRLEIPERPHHPRWVARVTRPVSLRFTATEVRRVRALVAIASFAEDLPRSGREPAAA